MIIHSFIKAAVAVFVTSLALITPVSAVHQGVDQKPAFTLQTPAGETLQLETFIGRKPVLLVFWATWCPLCTAAVPRLNRINLAGKIQILAINVEERRGKVAAFISRNGVSYPVVLDPSGATAKSFRVPGVPAYAVVDTAGRVVYRGESFPETIVTDSN